MNPGARTNKCNDDDDDEGKIAIPECPSAMTSTVEGPSSASFFPLATLSDVANFFSAQLDATDPDLALLSIVIGALEHQWTATKNAPVIAEPSSTTASASSSSSSTPSHSPCDMKVDPPLEWHVVDALQTKFASIIEGFCDPALLAAARNEPDSGFAVRPLVKHVADIVWNTLSKSQYKDRPHLQSIYSYLTGACVRRRKFHPFPHDSLFSISSQVTSWTVSAWPLPSWPPVSCLRFQRSTSRSPKITPG